MALRSYNYKPYRSRRKNKRNRRIRFLFFILLLFIIGIVIYNWGDEQPRQDINSQQTEINESVETQPRNIINMPGTDKQQPEEKQQIAEKLKKQQIETEPVNDIDIPDQPVATKQSPATLEELRQIEQKAKELIKDKKIIEARDLLNETLKLPLTAKQRNDLKKTLASFSDIWLFSDKVLPNDNLCSIHKVKPGEVPAIIGRQYDVPWQFLLKINNIDDPKRLWAGAKIKVVRGPFNAKIYRSTFTMDVFLQGTYVKSYKVGLGKIGPEGNPTPTGLWRVKDHGRGKLKRPPWPDPVTGKLVYYEDTEYPLGERWIGLDGIQGDAKGRTGFGIHGTNEPESIGKFASDGCIRLTNENVLEFYDMATEGMTEIQIVD